MIGHHKIQMPPGLATFSRHKRLVIWPEMRIVLLRKHNHIADGLQSINHQWDDETTFQEARRINTAQYLHMPREHDQTTKSSYVNDYNSHFDLTVIESLY